jgi:hypothetical protein
MANWNLPTITSGYIDFVTEMNNKIADAATLQLGAPTNLPNQAIRYNRSINIFEEWDLTTWNPKVIGITGGGTGSNNAAGSRTNLGLGSMATQNSNAVSITGGSITGVQYSGSDITTGIIALSRGGTGASLALGASGQVMMSLSGQVNFADGDNITKLNASNLVVGTIPDARLSTNVPFKHVINQFTRAQRISNAGGDWPRITLIDLTQGPDSKIWEINIVGGQTLNFWALNDSESSILGSIAFFRNGSLQASGLNDTPLNASNLTTGTVNPARLGAGAANSSTYLRGDSQWVAVAAGGGIPSGLIALFDTACPAGWTRVSALDGRFPLGSTGYGSAGGSSSHNHSVGGNTDAAGIHSHGFSGNTGSNNLNAGALRPGTGSVEYFAAPDHYHSFSGNTNDAGNHSHSLNGSTNTVDTTPPYLTVVYCRKD